MNRDITVSSSNSASLKGAAIQTLFAGLFGLILAFVILCIISAYLFFNPLSQETVTLISVFSKYICAAAAAFIACANKRSKGYLRGMAGALCFVLLGALFFGLFSADGLNGATLLYDILICSIIGVLSGAVAVNFNARKKK